MTPRVRIPDFYNNKNILITGGTGSLGVALVEKFLRSFPQIGNLFLIVRRSKGKSVQQRSNEYFDIEGFQSMKSRNADFRKKVVWLEGDVSKIGLGLSKDSENIIKHSVNIIFHAAAVIRLNGSLKSVINNNIRGTNELLKIAQRSKNIESFMHISTAFIYARDTRQLIKEQLYPHPIDPQALLQIAETQTAESIENLKDGLLLDWSNMYTYTKNASEHLIQQYAKTLPVGIHRPGSVIQSYAEPYPYWIYNLSGYSIFLREASKGNIHLGHPETKANCIPMDMTINSIIAAAYHTAKTDNMKIYNYTSSNNPIKFNDGIKWYLQGMKDPPSPIFAPSKYKIICYIKDAMLTMKRKPPRYVKSMKKYQEFFGQFKFYSMKPYECEYKTLDELWNKMDDDEKKLLYFDVKGIDWKNYFLNMNKSISRKKM